MFASIRQYPKQWVSSLLSVLGYAASLYFLFYRVHLIYGAIAIAVLLVALHFLVMSTPQDRLSIRKRYWVLWVCISGLALGIASPDNGILIVASSIVFHIGLYVLWVNKRNFIINNMRSSQWGLCNAGMYLFTIFVTISYSILMVGIIRQIPFDCDAIYQRYDAVGSIVTRPWDQVSDNIATWWDTLPRSNGNSNNISLRLQEIENLQIWDGIMNQRETINKNICNTIFESIKEQFQKPGFQIAILFPLFLILSSIVRLLLYVVSAINWIIVILLIKTRVYRKRTVMREVEEWY